MPGQQPYGAPPKKKGGALKVVLIVLGVFLLLCIAGGIFAFVKGKDKVEDVVAASKISVVEPAQLGGRDKVTDPTLQSTVESLDTEMKNIKGTTSSVGAIYGDLQKQDVVLIAAASTLQGTAQSRYDEFTTGMNSGGFSTDKLTDTEPGPLGGIAKCGDSTAGGVPTAVCVWSDQGSVGMVAMLFKKKADLEKEFVSIRGQIEQKA
jgi:flagellar basal body-associated protein FliL